MTLTGNVTEKAEPTLLENLEEYEHIYAPIIFTLMAFFTRMWRIGLSPIVTWDEAQYVFFYPPYYYFWFH